MMLYAKVVVGLAVSGPFDYSVPPQLSSKIKIGSRAWVNFSNRRMPAYIVGLSKKTSVKNLKPILELIDETALLDERMLLLTRQIADYYCCSWGQAIETALPPALRKGKNIPLEDKAGVLLSNQPSPIKNTLIHDLGDCELRWSRYFEYLKEAINNKKSAIVLLRDINFARKAKEKISAGLGVTCALLYRGQPREPEEWQGIREGRASVVVGTRSAIFAPLDNLGLVIIDEEQDSVYKQDQVPHYHAREAAFMRAKIDNAAVVMAASAFSLESFYLAQNKKIEYSAIPRAGSYPEIKLVASGVFKAKNILSRYLEDAIADTLNSGGKAMLFLNRKGFATFSSCSGCGKALKCPRCSINLVYHFKESNLSCGYCNFKMPAPSICPSCNSGYIKYSGLGTEKIESELSRIFPSAKIKILGQGDKIETKEAGIYISSEGIIRGPGPVFDLIGVLSLDNSLNRVDLRASEKAFILLSGLLKLTDKKIIIQTGLSSHHSLRALLNKDSNIFYEEELKQRKQLNFPPYRHFALVKLRHKKEERVKAAAHDLFTLLNSSTKNSGVKAISVNPGQPAKLRDNFYWQILLSSASALKLVKFLKIRLKNFPHSGIIVTVDVDPV